MKTPYLKSKKIRINKTALCWVFIIFMLFCIFGCAKKTDSVNELTQSAHQQIIAIRETLPKECQTKAIDEQLKAHDMTVESIKSNCDTQKQVLTEEKMRWKWSFISLSIIILVYIAKKVFK